MALPHAMPWQDSQAKPKKKEHSKNSVSMSESQTWTRCMFSVPFHFIISLLRGEFKNYVFCCLQGNPLITVIQVLLKFLSTMGNRSLFHMQNSALWTRISHVTAGKVHRDPQTNCTPDGQRGSPPLLPKLNEMHIYVHVLCL